MAITEGQLQERGKAPTRENSKSAATYEELKGFLQEEWGNQVDIFLQGSYANSTNIKKDSDIDIVLCYQNSYFGDISNLTEDDKKIYNSNRLPAKYLFSQFKQDVENFLIRKYGSKVERKDKCIRINLENERYVDADIVPSFVHKRFYDYKNALNCKFDQGIEFISDEGKHIISFPKLHKENGEEKNQNTNGKYKDIVRIIKNSKKYLVDSGKLDEKYLSSFMIECCVRNISNTLFTWNYYKDIVNNVIENIYSDMKNEDRWNKYAEVCDLFYLFRGSRNKNTPQEVMNFLEKIYFLINK